ncbi:Cbb3-type cytochrome oxidase, subunit 3 [Hoeflea sp. IMCC20628]|uniref:cbb3-type cytochrome oxidase subunit 3 n=1 Tax=Hoeflea sp. IMCC20628 TaxID=1620421 RepID=UPI00063BD6E8|nr:cbb3-type cytochrome c oxidase subunit 3 [Hoeflea sp. IMCC20628]AKH98801.1 Cbb3-type cytochrome oxidase, subunit 3 [Hoeflea sp. IMCC20628]
MTINHDLLVMIAKSFGLFYLMGFFIIVVIHTYRPSSKALAEHAARSVLEPEDQPCR